MLSSSHKAAVFTEQQQMQHVTCEDEKMETRHDGMIILLLSSVILISMHH